MASVDVLLAQPFEFHGGKVVSVRLREPSGAQYARLGEPTVTVFLQGGGAYVIEQPAIIKSYLEACVEHDLGGEIVTQLSLADARKLKRSLLDFFAEARDERSSVR